MSGRGEQGEDKDWRRKEEDFEGSQNSQFHHESIKLCNIKTEDDTKMEDGDQGRGIRARRRLYHDDTMAEQALIPSKYIKVMWRPIF